MIPKNFKDAVYVGIQLLLFLFYILWDRPVFSFILPEFLKYVCWLLFLFSAGLFVLAIWNIRRSISPYPSPKDHAQLHTKGAFAFSRHPIYSSIFIGLMTWGILQESGHQVIIAAILLLFFYIKAIYEEKLLIEMFPQYRDYQKKTGMLFPKFFIFKL